MHQCRNTWTDKDGVERYNYLCSRCGGCYACRHKAVWFDYDQKWMWKCKDGKFREVILDGKRA